MHISLNSETGRLLHVLVHRPGVEVETMDPHTMEHQLYNDILPHEVAVQEHGEMETLLRCFSRVVTFKDLLEECIAADPTGLSAILPEEVNKCLAAQSYTSAEIAEHLISGIKRPQNSFENMCSADKWLWKPLPNLFYSRDPGFVIGNAVVESKMHFDVRSPEARLLSYLFAHSPVFQKKDGNFDFSQIASSDRSGVSSIEGGDVHVFSKNHLIIGISQRTSATGIDWLARELMKDGRDALCIHAVQLPEERYCIHLDMVFSMVDTDTAIIYEPLMKRRLRIIEARYVKGQEPVFKEYGFLDEALKASGLNLNYISCGGNSKSRQIREQWLSGANAFCLAPGVVIGYSCNSGTIESFQKNGYQVVTAVDVSKDVLASGLQTPLNVVDYFKGKKTFISVDGIDLARGGGGIRCMTMPLAREN